LEEFNMLTSYYFRGLVTPGVNNGKTVTYSIESGLINSSRDNIYAGLYTILNHTLGSYSITPGFPFYPTVYPVGSGDLTTYMNRPQLEYDLLMNKYYINTTKHSWSF